MPFLSPGRAKKRHSFHDWRIGRREALSTPEARKGRGSEHGGFYAARSCTSGVDRRSRTEPRVRREMNVEPVVQPKAAPHCFSGSGVAGRNRPAWMGSVERQFHRRSQRGKGGASFPQKNSSIDRRVLLRAHEMRSERKRLVPCMTGLCAGPSTRKSGGKSTCNGFSSPARAGMAGCCHERVKVATLLENLIECNKPTIS